MQYNNGKIELHGYVDGDTPPQGDLTSPLTPEDILEEQRQSNFCQTVISTQVGQPSISFFEQSDGFLCRRNPREPELIQVVLHDALRHRVHRLAHYHVLAGHPGQTRRFGRLRGTNYWPKRAAGTLTTVREHIACAKNHLRRIKQAKPMRLFPLTQPLVRWGSTLSGILRRAIRGTAGSFHYGPLHKAHPGSPVCVTSVDTLLSVHFQTYAYIAGI